MPLPPPEMRKKACVIDDDPDLREIYKLALIGEDMDVSIAENGEVGLRCIRDERPDIILLDLQMPVKDGFEVLDKLKSDPNLAKIPVIILSNVDEEDAFRKAGKYNTRFYFVKSLTTPEKVADAVREILG